MYHTEVNSRKEQLFERSGGPEKGHCGDTAQPRLIFTGLVQPHCCTDLEGTATTFEGTDFFGEGSEILLDAKSDRV